MPILGPDGRPVDSRLVAAAEALVVEWLRQEAKNKWHMGKLRNKIKALAEEVDSENRHRR